MEKKYAALAAAAIGVIGLASAAHAATMSLAITYVGSTTSDATGALQTVNLSNPAFETSSWRHYFDIQCTFVPNGTQAFRLLIYDVSGSTVGASGPHTIAANNIVIGDPTAYLGNNLTFKRGVSQVSVFDGNADGGTPNDDRALFVNSQSAGVALTSLVGQPGSKLTTDILGNSVLNNLGLVAFSFNGPLVANQNAVITVSESAGNSFSFWDASDPDNVTFTTEIGGVTGGTFVIAGPPALTVPEPASLGVMAVGGIALLARRRRWAK